MKNSDVFQIFVPFEDINGNRWAIFTAPYGEFVAMRPKDYGGWTVPDEDIFPTEDLPEEYPDGFPVVPAGLLLDSEGRCFEGDDEFNSLIEQVVFG
jgi:hypothetical protein